MSLAVNSAIAEWNCIEYILVFNNVVHKKSNVEI